MGKNDLGDVFTMSVKTDAKTQNRKNAVTLYLIFTAALFSTGPPWRLT